MLTFDFTVWIPVLSRPANLPNRANDYIISVERLLDQLGEAISIVNKNIKIKDIIKAAPEEDVLDWLITGQYQVNTENYDFYCVNASVSFNEKDYTIGQPPYEEFWITVSGSSLSTSIDEILLLTELTRPGYFQTLPGAVTHGDRTISIVKPKDTFHFFRFDDDTKEFWPKTRELSLLDVCKWAACLGFSKKALATTPVSRALAAFSHAIRKNPYSEDILFRTMQGLEAFYCVGRGNSLRGQLSEKTKLFLGTWEARKNVVGHLYDIRSKFVHGSCNLPYPDTDYDQENKILETEIREGEEFSVRLLVATLQKCISDDISAVKWSYSYSADNSRNNS